MSNFINLKPVKRKKFSAREYLILCKKEKKNIAASRFIPPMLGSRDFGGFEVIYKRPVYQNTHG